MSEDQTMVQKAFAQIGERFDGIEKLLKREKPLPYDAQIEYLKQQSIATAYINTDISIYENGVWKLEVKCPTTGPNRFIGAGNQAGSDAVVAIACANSGYSMYPYRYGNSWNDSNLMTTDTRNRNVVRYEFSSGSQKLYVNGVLHKQSSLSYSASDRKIWIFACSQSNYTSYFRGNVEIYSAKLYRNGILIFDSIPVRVGSIGYLYDKVSKKLFGNSGTGNFVLGPDKS